MAAQPAIDLTDVDLVPAFRQATRVTRRAAGRATDLAGTIASGSPRQLAKDTASTAVYTAVGLGVLTWQRLQVRRREFERAMRD